MTKYKKNQNIRVAANFKAREFDCKGRGCCSSTLIDGELVKLLQRIRSHFNAPLTINSGYRCFSHNKAVGGSSGSKHKKGQAADIVVKGVSPRRVAAYAETIGIKGIGLYNTFVHIDTRKSKYFWYSDKQERRTTFKN